MKKQKQNNRLPLFEQFLNEQVEYDDAVQAIQDQIGEMEAALDAAREEEDRIQAEILERDIQIANMQIRIIRLEQEKEEIAKGIS